MKIMQNVKFNPFDLFISGVYFVNLIFALITEMSIKKSQQNKKEDVFLSL